MEWRASSHASAPQEDNSPQLATRWIWAETGPPPFFLYLEEGLMPVQTLAMRAGSHQDEGVSQAILSYGPGMID